MPAGSRVPGFGLKTDDCADDRQGVKARLRALTCTITVLVLFAGTARRSEMSERQAEGGAAVLSEPSAVELQGWLRRADFSTLTRIIEVAQADARREQASGRAFSQLLTAFHTDDPSLAVPLDAWVTQAPASWAARLARAEYGLAKAERAGASLPLATVIDDTNAALKVDAHLALAYVQAIGAYALAAPDGDTAQCRATAARGLAQIAGDVMIREALTSCLLQQPPSAARDREVEQHGMAGALDWDRARRTSGPAALPLYSQALNANPHWWFYRDRAGVYLDHDRASDALADTARGLAIVPDQPDLLAIRLAALIALGRVPEALTTRHQVEALDPTNPGLARVTIQARQRAVADARIWLDEHRNARNAVHRLDEALTAWPGDADIFYWRARAYLALADTEAATRDLERAVTLDGAHRPSYELLDRLLTDRRDWTGLVHQWTTYLMFTPSDPLAYSRRALAYRQTGRTASAAVDAAQACELGSRADCE